MNGQITALRVYIPDATYGRDGESDERSSEFKSHLESEYHLQFEPTGIGTGAAEPAFATTLLETAQYVAAGLFALFFLGERIEKNIDAWSRLYERLKDFFHHKPTFDIEGASVIAVKALSSKMGDTPHSLQLLGYRHESALVTPIEQVIGDTTDVSEIGQAPDHVLSATIHVFKIRAESNIFRVVVSGAEARVIEDERDNMRIGIPDNIAADVLVAHDRTCCVCQTRGKRVQIHHIDEDPSNNVPENLAALCFDCHDQTQIKGGFARSLNAAQVIKYRDDWTDRVAENKRRADDVLLQKQLGVIAAATKPSNDWHPPGPLELAIYIQSIPDTMQKAYELAQAEWNIGATNVVAQATYQVIRIAERLWIGLAAGFPPDHFGGKQAAEYVSDYIARRYELRYALMEPEGPRTGGSMMRPMAAYGVLLDVQDLIVLTVRMMVTFAAMEESVDLEKWKTRFADAVSSYSN
jgi:hypothetical protein